jgi:rhomboid protease GluP
MQGSSYWLPATGYWLKVSSASVLKRQTSGSVVCTSCGVLVGVNDETCHNCGRRNPGLWGFAPALRALGQDLGFVPFVIGACVIVYVLMLVFSRGQLTGGGLFSFGSPTTEAMFMFGASGAGPVFGAGRWWTVLSASWLHGGLLHIFLNMLAMRSLAPSIADLYGPGRMVVIYTVGGVAGFILSSFAGAYFSGIFQGAFFTVGASASIAALIGAVLAYGHRSGSSQARAYAMQYVLMLVMMGFLFPGIDNYAHLGGFGGGYLVAKLLDPLTPERVDHMAAALVCLVLSVVSIVYSFVHGLQFLQ